MLQKTRARRRSRVCSALTFLVGRPVVRAPLALAVVGARPAVTPLGAARVPARPVALGGQPVGQGELSATPAVLSDPTH